MRPEPMPMSSPAARAARSRVIVKRAWQVFVRDVGFSLLVLLAIVIGYRVTLDVPLALGGIVALSTAVHMHARLAMGRGKTVLLVGLTAMTLLFAGAPPRIVAALLAAGLAGSELIARCTRRSAVLLASAGTGAIAAGVLVAVVAVFDRPLSAAALPREALLSLVGGVMAAPLLQTLGPVLEWMFGHTTRLTMSEWLNFEHPLLRELAAKAPGTFQHSVNVGVLAASGTSAIGGDNLLAHIGGLYHDVGKLRAPKYFIENQQGPNPHDGLPPWDSARILRAHVFDGIELVREHGMGDRVAAFVREHHGTGSMRLQREMAEALGRDDPDGETYRYPGPRPRSRESGIVMLADQLDATSRAEPPADEADAQAIVDRTFERVQSEVQLVYSGLSDTDLATLRAAFTRALMAMYHRRLTYPSSSAEAPSVRRSPFVPRLFSRRGPRSRAGGEPPAG